MLTCNVTKLWGRSLAVAATFPGRFRATGAASATGGQHSAPCAPPAPPLGADWLWRRAAVRRRGGAGPRFGRRRWRRRPRWARRRPCAAPCTGSAAGCASTTTRRCRKRCVTPRPSAASISWTPGSPPPPPWASTAGGEWRRACGPRAGPCGPRRLRGALGAARALSLGLHRARFRVGPTRCSSRSKESGCAVSARPRLGFLGRAA